jgi:hypothetical protein
MLFCYLGITLSSKGSGTRRPLLGSLTMLRTTLAAAALAAAIAGPAAAQSNPQLETRCRLGAAAAFPNMLDAFENEMRALVYRNCLANGGQAAAPRPPSPGSAVTVACMLADDGRILAHGSGHPELDQGFRVLRTSHVSKPDADGWREAQCTVLPNR